MQLTAAEIKDLKKLKDKKYRRETGLFLVEGDKFCFDLLDTNIVIDKTITTSSDIDKRFPNVVTISEKIMLALATTKTPQNIICICKMKYCEEIDSIGNSLILDNLQDPGNVGTLIRTALSFGFKDIYLINSVDVYSEKLIRSSAGTIFKARLHNVTFESLKVNKERIADKFIIADMNGDNLSEIYLPKSRKAVIIGNEGNGVSKEFYDIADTIISIPMENKIESLNAGVAGSIIMYKLREGEQHVRT